MKTWKKPEIVDLKMTLTAGTVGFGGIANEDQEVLPQYSGHGTPEPTPFTFTVSSTVVDDTLVTDK